MNSGKRVPTDKQRASTYLETSKFEKFNQLAEEAGLSVSGWIEKILDEHTEEGAIVVTFPPEILEHLASISKENFRSVDDQIKMIVSEWLKTNVNN